MKSFVHFLGESPHETENVVPVRVYLPRQPLLGYQSVIPKIRDAVLDGSLKPYRAERIVSVLFPTQTNVCQTKVFAYRHLDTGLLPLVMHDSRFGHIIIDGHHRICAQAAINPNALILVDEVSRDDVEDAGISLAHLQ